MDKSPDAFRTISEVAELLDTPAHVLRFWESRFPQIKPVKRAGGRRYYRPADMALLAGIRRLLHEEGLTIRGVQKILREQGVRHVSGLSEDEEDVADIDLGAEHVDTEDAADVSAPIPLFPAPRGKVLPEPEIALPEDEPEDAQDDLDRVDEAALLAALEGPIEDARPSRDTSEGKQDIPHSETPKVSAPELPVEPAAEVMDEAQPEPVKDVVAATRSVPVDDVAAKAPRADAQPEKSDAGEPVTNPQNIAPSPQSAPPPVPASMEITGHWLPADLRGLQPGTFGEKRGQAEALLQRLEVLRNRVGDLGRVPRR